MPRTDPVVSQELVALQVGMKQVSHDHYQSVGPSTNKKRMLVSETREGWGSEWSLTQQKGGALFSKSRAVERGLAEGQREGPVTEALESEWPLPSVPSGF